jgi:hypothetical protein
MLLAAVNAAEDAMGLDVMVVIGVMGVAAVGAALVVGGAIWVLAQIAKGFTH